jgi:nucleoside-diphosphate-sugar epimerase
MPAARPGDAAATAGRRILVTGASGFIGRVLVARLAQAGHDVLAVSRAPMAAPPGVRHAQVLGYQDAATLRGLATGCDAVVHLAAIAHRAVSGPQAGAMFEPNVASTLAVTRAAVDGGAGRFVLVSSIGVNGNCTTGGRVLTEADAPGPVEAYAMSKLRSEEALRAIAASHPALEAVIVRPPLVYGPNPPGNFGRLWRAVAGRAWLPFGRIDNRRSFIGIDNLCDLLELCVRHPAAAGEVFLAADTEDVSTAELVRRMARALDVAPRLLDVPMPLVRLAARMAGRAEQLERLAGSLQVDAGKARRMLGWAPALTLDQGLARAAAAERSSGTAP